MHSVYVTFIKDVKLFTVVFVHFISYIAIDGFYVSPCGLRSMMNDHRKALDISGVYDAWRKIERNYMFIVKECIRIT